MLHFTPDLVLKIEIFLAENHGNIKHSKQLKKDEGTFDCCLLRKASKLVLQYFICFIHFL